jgi:hypothetical protein
MVRAQATFEIPRLRTLARHAVPYLVEATFVPLALFYVSLWLLGVWGALTMALAWSYSALFRRLAVRQRVPGILLLGAVVLTARTGVALSTGSTFVYFLQPTLGTVLVATAFLVSVRTRRPLAERLAADFCPLPPSLLANDFVRRFFSQISLLWAFVNLANAALTIWLLVSQPLATYLMAKTIVSLTCTSLAIAASTAWFCHSMRRHGVQVLRARA